MSKHLFLIAALMLGSGASHCYGASPLAKDLKPVTSNEYIVLTEDMTYHVKARGLFSSPEWDVGLRAGTYRPEFANRLGTFYRGPDACVYQKPGPGPFTGGLWVPRDRVNYRVKPYYYQSTSAEDAGKAGGLVGLAIRAASEGKIVFTAEPPAGSLLEGIVIRNLPVESAE